MTLEEEINQAKSYIMEGFELALSMNPTYTKEQFLTVLKKEYKRLAINFNEIIRSGSHPSNELRVAISSHKQIIKELEGEK